MLGIHENDIVLVKDMRIDELPQAAGARLVEVAVDFNRFFGAMVMGELDAKEPKCPNLELLKINQRDPNQVLEQYNSHQNMRNCKLEPSIGQDKGRRAQPKIEGFKWVMEERE